MLTRTGRKILDSNLASLIRLDPSTPAILEEVVLDIHEYPQLVTQQIVSHRYFNELVYGVLRILDIHTPNTPRIAGNAAYVFGALLESENGRDKVIQLLKDPERLKETQHLLPSLCTLIELNDVNTMNAEIEAQTNASGTTALIFEIDESRAWAFEQPSCEWMIFTLARCLLDTDMWVAANCALTLARLCMSEEGRKKIMEHKENEAIIIQLIMAVGVDNEGRGMNSAFALAYLCDEEENLKKIAYMKECLDLVLGLMNMLRSVDDGCRKNAAFCLKTMSQWEEGQDRINDDPDIQQLLKLLCNMLTCGDEDLSKLASVILTNCATKKEGYMLQKDLAPIKTTLEHVLKQMNISESYRKDAFEALKVLMIPKPEAPQLKVNDAYTVEAKWEAVQAKSGAEVFYELYCDNKVVYTGIDLQFIVRGLNERTDYEFRVRAFTDEDEESFISEGSVIQTFRAISSPPRNLRAVQVTSSQIKIVWEKPSTVLGNLKGYYVQEQGSSIHYEPVYLYHFASNLEADREYTFEVCAVTQRGRGQAAVLTVRTLRNDYFAPSKPKAISVGTHEMVITWKPPVAPPGKINGYEVMCNGKSIYFGMNKRCIATMLQPNSKYKFTVVAWTNEGRTESQPTYKKTSTTFKNKSRKQPWKNKEELMKWLDSKQDDDDLDNLQSDDETINTERSTTIALSSQQQDYEQDDYEEDEGEEIEEEEQDKESEPQMENRNESTNQDSEDEEEEIEETLEEDTSPDNINKEGLESQEVKNASQKQESKQEVPEKKTQKEQVKEEEKKSTQSPVRRPAGEMKTKKK